MFAEIAEMFVDFGSSSNSLASALLAELLNVITSMSGDEQSSA